jgi:MFS transporter, YNFM family, putative membrane transport protein
VTSPGPATALLLYLAATTAFVAMYLPQPILPVLARDFGVSPSAASLTVSALIFSLALSSLLIGPMSDRIGRKPLMAAALILLAVPSLLCAFAPNITVLLLLRFLQGMLLPGITAISVAYIAEEFPPQWLGPLLGGYIASNVLGGLLSRVLSGFTAEAFGWPWAFVMSAALSFAVGLLLLLFLPPSRRFVASDRLSRAYRGMIRHLKNPRLLGAYGVGFALFFAFMAVFTYLPFYLEAPPFGFSPAAIGLVYTVYAAGVISSPVAGLLSRGLGRQMLMVFALAFLVLANLGTLYADATLLILCLILLCFANFATQSTATAYTAAQAAENRAGATALYLFAYYVGGSLGAYLPGLLWPPYGWAGVVALTVTALMMALAAAKTLCRD